VSVSATSVDVAWLDWLAETAGTKVEVDIEGSIIVTPATDEHFVAVTELLRQLGAAAPEGVLVGPQGPRWAPLGGDRPSYVPDVSVVQVRALQRPKGVYSLDPPPLLVVEIVSPESRRRDLNEKAAAYLAGGAQAYWTVELPGLAEVSAPLLTIRRRGIGEWVSEPPASGAIDVDFPFAVRLDLDKLAL
jgi:Uma2 family endonuclease